MLVTRNGNWWQHHNEVNQQFNREIFNVFTLTQAKVATTKKSSKIDNVLALATMLRCRCRCSCFVAGSNHFSKSVTKVILPIARFKTTPNSVHEHLLDGSTSTNRLNIWRRIWSFFLNELFWKSEVEYRHFPRKQVSHSNQFSYLYVRQSAYFAEFV